MREAANAEMKKLMRQGLLVAIITVVSAACAGAADQKIRLHIPGIT